MTFNEFKELVIAECAAQGVTEYELYYQAGASTSVDTFQHSVNEFTSSYSGGVCFRAIVGGKMGYASTEDLSAQQAKAVVLMAMDNALNLEAEEAVFLGEGGQEYEPMEDKNYPLPTTEEFPWVFNTGRGSVGQWHTQSRTKEVKFVEDVSAKKAYLFMNTRMAEENGIQETDLIRVYSVNGQNAVFAVKITDNVQYGELYAPIHYIECNKLTPSLYDSYSKEPSYKATPVRFEKYVEE